VALYDRILRDFRQAALAVESGEVEKRVHALNHAQPLSENSSSCWISSAVAKQRKN